MTNSCENVFLFMPRNDFIRSKCGLKKFYSIHMLLFVQFKSLFTFERLNNFKTQVWKINSTKETCLDFLKTLFSRIVWSIFQNLKEYVFSCFYQVTMIVTCIISLPFLRLPKLLPITFIIRNVLDFILDVVLYTTCVPLQSSNINELRNRIKDVVNWRFPFASSCRNNMLFLISFDALDMKCRK